MSNAGATWMKKKVLRHAIGKTDSLGAFCSRCEDIGYSILGKETTAILG